MVYGKNKNVGVYGSRMNRKQFGKVVGMAAAGVAAGAMGLGGVVNATPPVNCQVYKDSAGTMLADGGENELWVFGQNNSSTTPTDLECTQWAVDYVSEGGMIHLIGLFDFGIKIWDGWSYESRYFSIFS